MAPTKKWPQPGQTIPVLVNPAARDQIAVDASRLG